MVRQEVLIGTHQPLGRYIIASILGMSGPGSVTVRNGVLIVDTNQSPSPNLYTGQLQLLNGTELRKIGQGGLRLKPTLKQEQQPTNTTGAINVNAGSLTIASSQANTS